VLWSRNFGGVGVPEDHSGLSILFELFKFYCLRLYLTASETNAFA